MKKLKSIKRKYTKNIHKTTIDVNEVVRQLQGRKKTCTKKFHSARKDEY